MFGIGLNLFHHHSVTEIRTGGNLRDCAQEGVKPVVKLTSFAVYDEMLYSVIRKSPPPPPHLHDLFMWEVSVAADFTLRLCVMSPCVPLVSGPPVAWGLKCVSYRTDLNICPCKFQQ